MRIVQLSLKHGISPLSPLGFAFYGSFLASMGDIREGCRFAKISRKLLDRIGTKQSRGNVAAYATQIMAYVEPVQSVLECHVDGHKAAMAAGSTSYALLNLFLRSGLHYWSGKSLSTTKSALEEITRLIKQHKHLMLLVLLMPLSRTVSTLQGASVETFSSSANELTQDPTKIENELRKTNTVQSRQTYYSKMYIAFIFRRFDKTKFFATKYADFKVGVWVTFFHQAMHTFYEGLCSYWIGREENIAKWISKGNESMLALQKLVQFSVWNFENKYLLLQAEEHFSERNFELAEKLYDEAISSAKEHRFVNEQALANELAGFFYLETGRRQKSIHYFSQAIKKYNEWEAYAKVKSLESYVEEVVTSTPPT